MLVSECVKFRGRMFVPTEAAQDAICQLEWAYGILARPNSVYQNGKQSHVVAGELIEKYEDVLINYERYTA